MNHAAEVGGTAHLTEPQAAHALGSLSHGLGLALGVNWLSFKEGWQPVGPQTSMHIPQAGVSD